jgi:hypothetical protein
MTERKRASERRFKVGGQAFIESLEKTWDSCLPDGLKEWVSYRK